MVDYRAGLLYSLFRNSWKISTYKDSFSCKRRSEYYRIEYFEILDIKHSEGTIWSHVVVTTQKFTLCIKGFSKKRSVSLCKELESNAKNAVISRLLGNERFIKEIKAQAEKILKLDQYISQTNIRNNITKINNISSDLSHPFFEFELLPAPLKDYVNVFLETVKPDSTFLKQLNEKFVDKSIQQHSSLFDRLEKFPLNEEQIRAAIIDEDRNLLIAAAGSGKTSTILAKAIYLVCAGLAKSEEILILAYNREAQIELEKRGNDILYIIPECNIPIKIKTFHSYGYEIIAEMEDVRPKISEFASGSKKRQVRLFTDLIKNLYDNDPKFMLAWRQFLLVGKHPAPDLFNIKSKEDYETALEELGAIRRNLPDGKQLLIPTLDGKEVRSFEEAQIVNWLVLNGVKYEYEKKYINPSELNELCNYNPDFYYPEVDLYHEHFAINANGETPSFLNANYLNGVEWKRSTHQKNNTKLIETHSAHFFDGSIFNRLEKLLRDNNVPFNPLEKSEIDELISNKFDPEADLALYITFLRHFKANNSCYEQIQHKASELSDRIRVSTFINLFEMIYKEYSRVLKETKAIDFEDQINMASELLESRRYQHAYKYILVDEFQDISKDRMRMIRALLNQNEQVKLFAVGDDWQSIYRFAGADIEIMTNFTKHFGATSQNYLTQTYRSFQGIVDVASTFVQRNIEQLRKNVIAVKNTNKDQIFILEYEDPLDQNNKLKELLKKLNSIQNKEKLTVFLLARYNHAIPKSYNKYQHLDVKFSTIHAAKGLQADYVILLNVEAGRCGFPSMIDDDPLLSLVLPKKETYPHAEERRLMYVAITRAKRGVFIFSNLEKVSTFITELSEIAGVNKRNIFIE